MYENPKNEIQKLENEIYDLTQKLEKLRKDTAPVAVKNYTFRDLNGAVSLLDLFTGKDILFAIHNMGQGCRFCTTWADGLNGFLPHLESQFAVVLLSKDTPELQRQFANSRGWRYRMASHGGTDYLRNKMWWAAPTLLESFVTREKMSRSSRKTLASLGPEISSVPYGISSVWRAIMPKLSLPNILIGSAPVRWMTGARI